MNTEEDNQSWMLVVGIAVIFGLAGLLIGYFVGKDICIKTPSIIYIEKSPKQ